MSEHLLLKKRQKQRKRSALNLTVRNILGLVLLSLLTYAGFRIWVGNPTEALCGDNCESMYSLMAWVLAFAMIFGAIIAAGAVIGVIVALLRRRAAAREDDFMRRFAAPEDPDHTPENDG